MIWNINLLICLDSGVLEIDTYQVRCLYRQISTYTSTISLWFGLASRIWKLMMATCWAQIWILQHINCVFLMIFLQFGTLSVKWISHIRLMDLSYSCVLFLHNSNLQLCQVDLKWSCTWKCTLLGSQSYKSQRKEDSAKRFFSKSGEESSFWMNSSYV